MIFPLLLLSASMAADTLVVDHARMEGPYTIQQPYAIDSLDVKGKSFDVQEVFKQNKKLVDKSRIRKTQQTVIQHGDALTAVDSTTSLRQLQFSIETSRFAKGRLEINKLKN